MYDALLARFMKHNAVTQSDDIPSIDTEGSTNYRTKLKFQSSSVHIGCFTKQHALYKHLFKALKYIEFFKEVHEF